MTEDWTAHKTAEELLNVLPGLNRLVASHLRTIGEEETTLMQLKVLTLLIEHPISVSELARRGKVSLQSASAQLQRLVDRGWVVRAPDPADRRRSLLQITSDGLACVQATETQIVGHLAEFLGELTPAEVNAAQVLLPALRRILATPIMAYNVKSK